MRSDSQTTKPAAEFSQLRKELRSSASAGSAGRGVPSSSAAAQGGKFKIDFRASEASYVYF